MENSKNHELLAKENAASGLNCCQSVFAAFSGELGIKRDAALLAASCFGSGISCGEVCGAVTGALMAIGLSCGFTEGTSENKAGVQAAAKAFIDDFRSAHGSIYCRELIGYNITESPEMRQRAVDEGAFLKICRGLIGDSARRLESFLEEHDEKR